MRQNETLVRVGQIFELAKLIRIIVKTTTPHTSMLFYKGKMNKTEFFESQ
jgi:hypothetical protein